MSVINTMLQDLDKRHGRPGGEAVPGDAIRSTKPPVTGSRRRNVLIVLVGLAMAVAAGAWWTRQRAVAATSLVAVPLSSAPLVASKAPPAEPQIASAAAVAPMPAPQLMAAAHAAMPTPTVRPLPAADKVAALAAPDVPKTLKTAPSATPSAFGPAEIPGRPDKVATTGPPANTAAATSRAATAKTYSPMQVSANLVAEAGRFDRQGHLEDAKASLGRALVANPVDIQARRMLVRLQLDTGRVEEAVALLVEGQRLHPEQPDFTLTLARLKAETGDNAGAIQLLEEGRAAARDEPQYHALLAALLVRAQRHDEAVQHYLVALRNDPANARWLLGVGVALEATGNNADAAEAYRRAEGTSRLTSEMATFASERLAQLRTLERAPSPEATRSALAPRR